MSFIESAFAAHPLHTVEQFMETFIAEAVAAGMPDIRGAAVCAGMCGLQEAGDDRGDGNGRQIWTPGNMADPAFAAHPENFPHDSLGDDGASVGPNQQQAGANWGWGGYLGDPKGTAARMDMTLSVRMFYTWPGSGLKSKGYSAANAQAANDSIQAVQGSGVPNAYAQWWALANQLYDQVANGGTVTAPTIIRPDFNEINQIGWDSSDPHGSVRSMPPRNWLLHTQEGDGNAEQLAAFLRSTTGSAAVSYHYTIAEDRNDHGVTVCDVIDTDLYSWAVLNANVFTINACFAGSYAAQTRDEWIANYRNAIRVAAYLAVEDCQKYPTMSANLILPPYGSTGPGLSDHRWVTDGLGIGTHTDVGGPMGAPWNGFPWDIYQSDVLSFLAAPVSTIGSAPPPAVLPGPPAFVHPSTDQMVTDIWDQLRGPQGAGWPQDGNHTPVESIWALRKNAGI